MDRIDRMEGQEVLAVGGHMVDEVVDEVGQVVYLHYWHYEPLQVPLHLQSQDELVDLAGQVILDEEMEVVVEMVGQESILSDKSYNFYLFFFLPMTAVKQTIIDSTDANNVYYGSADLGRATTSNFWSIYLKNTNGSVVTTKYPIGLAGSPSEKENFIWDERAQYNYSLTDDTTAPTLSTVTIASNNSTTTLAKVGDVVTLTIVASEVIETPVVTIGAGSATAVL